MSEEGAARGGAAASPVNVSPGDQIAGYRLEEQIGQGGMAVVYRALDERLDRRVALKLLAPGLASDTAFRTRFIRESRAAAAVDHPNIIPVYEAGDAGGFLFISMRFVQGGDVRSLIADGQAVPPARAWPIISQVAAALDAAHEHGLVHRDVKPANMLLDASGRTGAPNRAATDEHVYLSDFGISKRTLASNLTSTGQFVGTLDYIAPEQIEGQAVDGRTDQYSLACAAFELLSGIPPFRRSLGLALINAHLSEQPPSLVAKRPDLPAAVDQVLAKAMAKRVEHRYPTCAEFATDLGRALGFVPGPLQAAPFQPKAGNGGAPQWQPTELAGPAAAAVAAAANAAGQQQQPPPVQYEQTQYQPSPGQPGTNQQYPQGTYQQGPQGTYQQGPQGTYQQGQYATGQTPPPQYSAGQYPPGQYPPGGYQPNTFPQPAPPAKRSRGLVIGAVVATLVIAGAAGAVAYKVLGTNKGNNPPTGQSSSPPPRSVSSSSPPTTPATAQAQAMAVSNLLSTSEATRGQLQPAVSAIQDQCSTLSSSQIAGYVATIQTVANQRQSEYSQAQALMTNLLPSGTELKTDLLAALQYSMNADNDYLQWAQEEQQGCFPATESTAFNNAGNVDVQAVNAKTDFANLWNGVAPKYNQPTVNADNI